MSKTCNVFLLPITFCTIYRNLIRIIDIFIFNVKAHEVTHDFQTKYIFKFIESVTKGIMFSDSFLPLWNGYIIIIDAAYYVIGNAAKFWEQKKLFVVFL